MPCPNWNLPRVALTRRRRVAHVDERRDRPAGIGRGLVGCPVQRRHQLGWRT